MEELMHIPTSLRLLKRERQVANDLYIRVGQALVATGRECETTEDELVAQTLKARYANLEQQAQRLGTVRANLTSMINQERNRLKMYF
jgi:chaperonin cofactor prefoldin